MKKYLMTGLLVWVPLAITAWLISVVVGAMDGLLRILPDAWQPGQWLPPPLHLIAALPGLGVLLAVLIVLVTGVLAANFLGKQLFALWDKLLSHIPVVRSIYSSVKQVSDTLLSDSGNAFKTAVLVQYPRAGSWAIAFQTGIPAQDITAQLSGEHLSVFVPTTPNPTSGFFLIVPVAETKPLAMSVDEALKYVVSMGVVVPKPHAVTTEIKPNKALTSLNKP
jgi:uncharacterized membrane protein